DDKEDSHLGNPRILDWTMGHGQQSMVMMKLKEAQNGLNGSD
ncbi:hypothetical protein Tco_1273027, partial [Tanacetum coccineum]